MQSSASLIGHSVSLIEIRGNEIETEDTCEVKILESCCSIVRWFLTLGIDSWAMKYDLRLRGWILSVRSVGWDTVEKIFFEGDFKVQKALSFELKTYGKASVL